MALSLQASPLMAGWPGWPPRAAVRESLWFHTRQGIPHNLSCLNRYCSTACGGSACSTFSGSDEHFWTNYTTVGKHCHSSWIHSTPDKASPTGARLSRFEAACGQKEQGSCGREVYQEPRDSDIGCDADCYPRRGDLSGCQWRFQDAQAFRSTERHPPRGTERRHPWNEPPGGTPSFNEERPPGGTESDRAPSRSCPMGTLGCADGT